MNAEKLQFLQFRFISLLKQIPSDTPALWGKMAVQQMIEHFADSVRIASGKTVIVKLITPEEHLEKMHSFLMSEKPMRENVANPLVSNPPPPVRNATVENAILDLDNELSYFFKAFEENKLQTTRNPFFGDLNFEENVQLLYKHAVHHLRQFGVAAS